MKQTIFTLLLISAIGLVSCRKHENQPDIAQYDATQIQNYRNANGLTNMVQDTTGGDTSGIYYHIINPGSGPLLSDTNNVSFVFWLKSFDGKYSSLDTIENHYQGYVGHITTDALPYGLQYAILNDLKKNGGSMRLLIPSRLAYGINGYGTGSTQNAGSHIAGNQGLDYYVHLIGGDPAVKSQAAYQADYDQLVMQNYMKANSLTGYTQTQSTSVPGNTYFYKLTTAGAGPGEINQNTQVEVTYTGTLMDNVVFDGANVGADSVELQVPNLIKGVQDALTHATLGTTISMILPSALCYGTNSTTGAPANSCLRFEFTIVGIH
jgi:FKBP-type peptidyl-prolyl cis-trans isomerase FkpA